MVKSITLSKYLGKKFKTNNYGEVVIIRYNGSNSVEVQFINTGYETTTTIMQIKKGTVKDRTVPSIYDVGVVLEEIDSEDDRLLEQYVLEGFNPKSLPFFNQEKDQIIVITLKEK